MIERTGYHHPLLVWAWSLVRLDFFGVAFGALFFCLSLTPSLLPRDWLFAGLIGGINSAIGYGIGVGVGKLLYRFGLRYRSWWPPSPRVTRVFKAVIVTASVGSALLMLIPAAAWQRQVSAAMGIAGPGAASYLRTLLIALLVGAACVGTWRVLVDAVKLLARLLIRRWHLHHEVAFFIGTAIVVVLIITLVNGVLYRGFLIGASSVFQPQNSTTRAGVSQPLEPERSGSPTSFASWDGLGYQGRNFVAGGPDAGELTRVNGTPAQEPIRVYAGLETADTDEGRLAVLLSELERTDAFDRKLLVIIPTTGTGWINPIAARAIELMYNGDTALVGMQYSYLPSWISFLGDRQKSVQTGRMMIDAIHDRWSKLPPEHRPRLALYGESLGSLAGQGAFGWLPDIAAMDFSSVLWVGPPNESALWSGLVQRRDPGTREVEPRYDNGRTVRFSQAQNADEIARVASAPWEGTRVLFLQHASDPIVWWSPKLLFSRPDWLTEPPGADRTASMRWYPIVTFWQVGADMTNASGVPGGHGHNYGDSVLDGWVAVAAPQGWTPADTERIRDALHHDDASDQY
ncbi:alpha/beta hydrolase [Mycolicibacterium fluoranthenivorans]|uniref:Putative membrane protein n=1 Tax=Mycolicibacterium fluoranthenivorans TaxID=258505 RepID=A0A7X5U3N8_9MYCO|nr:alpha/beta hydrolase [Mycolicibacterium fluoranthenivorans]MCV7356323.1 alpha/beta-hydrolase family protein [Mycolicibacterium fluoranthenivorans]NIH97755.1 putative membrane protein [Mycolicibacterium fluoranthenivorans]